MAGSSCESKTTGSGAGSTFSRPSMRNRSVRSNASALSSSLTRTDLNRGSNCSNDALDDRRASRSRSLAMLMLTPVKSGMP